MRLAVAVAVMLAAVPAWADDRADAEAVEPPEPPRPCITTARRAGAVTLAIVPGVLTRGLGSNVACERDTGHRLLKIGAISLGVMAAGGLPIGLTYGSDKTILLGVPLLVGGTGVFLASWWSDIYVAAGGRRWRGQPRNRPALSVGLTTTWQHDGYRGERFYGAPVVEARRGRWAGAVTGFVTDDATSYGGRADASLRLWGRFHRLRDSHADHAGSFVEARAAGFGVRERDDHLSLATVETALRGRVDLAELDRNLRGTFFELDAGIGLETTIYAAGSTDVQAILLSKFSYGLYLPLGLGELTVFYDHRRDHLAGGLAAGRAAGFFGSVGTTGELALDSHYTITAKLEVGNAWITTLGLARELP